ncbi:epoxide hydrolase [Rhodococcus sp. IEGM 1366]|uniref:epoxide hydrolase family protein n=1 Tax=Rhodococcus sp. IEGM 1366 TaxID=3082223 RepID=UPI002954F4C5|nr:epoxide hydrolase [Rhodococcus sp. IEGM 1366]MDV8070986.1 epoxide hydrolase [Rhodococcus sp. IEGM 1366]
MVTNLTTNDVVVSPFEIDVDQSEVDDLRRRLAQTRWADPIDLPEGVNGIPHEALTRLFERWRDNFDWYAQQESLNKFAQVKADIGGQAVHAMHVRSERSDAVPLVLLHGWPSTFAEFRDVVEPLTQPSDVGSSAFHVVAPSLPGFAFSSPTPHLGWNDERMADAVIDLMSALDYSEYFVHGSDAGQAVAEMIAIRVPGRVRGLHVNAGGVKFASQHTGEPPTTDRQRLALKRFGEYMKDKSAYAYVQSTRPETLAYALTDSPVGQLAWIAEKFLEWGDPDYPVDDDHILTTVSIYWFTRTAASAGRFYREAFSFGVVKPPVEVPTAVAAFANDIVPAVREWAEGAFNIVQWTDLDSGAHFAALERPDLVVDSIRRFAAAVR